MKQLPFTRDARPRTALAGALLLWLWSLGAMAAATYHPYDDSSLTITSVGTPDPFISSFRGRYYMTFTAGNRVEIWSSSSLVDMEATAVKHDVWRPPPGTNYSADIWAPELHALRGRWYIYFAAADPNRGNESHRMYVLGGPPATKDPCAGAWEFLGPVRNMPDQWAIDGTVFDLEDQLYLAYSGWPIAEDDDEDDEDGHEQGKPDQRGELRMARSTQRREQQQQQQQHKSGHVDGDNKHNHANASDTSSGNTTTTTTRPKPRRDESGLTQHLYLIRLSDPLTASSRAAAISRAQQSWEITRDAGREGGGGGGAAHAINEGPQWLESADGRWRGLAYSCAGSWTPDYKMATLRYLGGSSSGGDPLDPAAWAKSRGPLLGSDITAAAATTTLATTTTTTTNDNDDGVDVKSGNGDGDGDGDGDGNKKREDKGSAHFGPGHGSFLYVGGGDVVAVYHATDGPYDGWENRRARVRRVVFTEMGPYMGRSFGVEGPVRKREGFVARFRARLLMKRGIVGKDGDGRRGERDGTEGLRAFLEARRLESEEAIGDEF